MATKLEIHKDFLDFLRLLNQRDARYLVIGGYAVGFHGYIRATNDFDVFVEISESNAEKLVGVFKKFGFNVPELSEGLFLEPGTIVRVGVPPVRLEVLNEISGVTFAECFKKRVVQVIGDVPINFIGRDDLLKNKVASDRDKDRIDVNHLTKGKAKAKPKPKTTAKRKKKT